MITHHFEQCEYYLSEIFQLLCEADNDAPFQIFGQIVSSNMRLGMTRTAIAHCFRRPCNMKTELIELLAKFERCQALRNKAVHASLIPIIKRKKLHHFVRPLEHQTLRFKAGALKPGRQFSLKELADADEQLFVLALEMKQAVRLLAAQLGERKRKRLLKLMPLLAPR